MIIKLEFPCQKFIKGDPIKRQYEIPSHSEGLEKSFSYLFFTQFNGDTITKKVCQ
jgi:hypothetical protein